MKILKDNQGNVLVKNGVALSVPGTSPDLEFPTYTGTVDAEGLAELGWDADDIAWLQAHVWWNAEDNEYWKVTEANKAFGPNGATPLTWENRNEQKQNPDLRYFPKLNLAPATNTSWYGAFTNFRYVVAIPTHGWDTTNVTNLGACFSACNSIRSVGDLSNWNTSKNTSLASMLGSCYNLLAVGDLSNWNTSSVTSIGSFLSNCFKIRYIGDLSSWDTANVTSFASAFYLCTSLVSVGDLSNWDTTKVTTMSNMFSGCCQLTRVGDLSRWDISKVTTLSSLFNGCYKLTTIGDLSGWDTSLVADFNSMFSNCLGLVYIGDLSKWDVSKATNLNSMFNYCVMLRSIGDISRWDTSKMTSLQSAFSGCRALEKLDVSSWDVEKVTAITTFLGTCVSLAEIDLTGWKLSACTVAGTGVSNSPFAYLYTTTILKLGPHFFDGAATTFYMTYMNCWTRDSIYESLYTNQTLRNTNSTAITVRLAAEAYDRLSQQDKDDIATKNITLMRG